MRLIITIFWISLAACVAILLNVFIPPLQAGFTSNAKESLPPGPYDDPRYARGMVLYGDHCEKCHSTKFDRIENQGLLHVEDRIPPGDWIYKWIRTPQTLIQSGDPYAIQIFEDANGALTDSFPGLTNEDIDAIMLFIHALSANK